MNARAGRAVCPLTGGFRMCWAGQPHAPAGDPVCGCQSGLSRSRLQPDHGPSGCHRRPLLGWGRGGGGTEPTLGPRGGPTDLCPRQGSRASWSHSGPAQPGWHSQTTLSFSTARHRPCLHTVQDLQPGETPSDCGGRALKSCSSLLMRTSWMQPWKPPSGRSVPWRRAERPVEVGMPVGRRRDAA